LQPFEKMFTFTLFHFNLSLFMNALTDYSLELGGKEYKTVKINNCLWMAENLAILIENSWFYEDNALYGEKFGRLYSWDAAMKACPEGWQLPSDKHWDELIDFLGGEQQAFKELIQEGESGFNALYAGYRNLQGTFLSIERAADFWTSTEAGSANAWLRYMIYKKDKVFRIIDDKRCGYSVRYIKDL
jgi:uncharacterized protein (TIGR02145 family)